MLVAVPLNMRIMAEFWCRMISQYNLQQPKGVHSLFYPSPKYVWKDF